MVIQNVIFVVSTYYRVDLCRFTDVRLLMFFLVIDHKYRFSPYFRCFSTFPPCFAKFIISPLFRENYYFLPTFKNSPLCFTQIHLLFTYFTCISFPPYFYHDAFMHHPMHALDAPVKGGHFLSV